MDSTGERRPRAPCGPIKCPRQAEGPGDTPGKNNGLIVGYVDILGNLHKALAIYASTGALGPGQVPVEEKEALATGLTLEEFRGRSFLKILDNRRAQKT